MTARPPQLAGDALAAVNHRGSHMQIIASAGAGKTEVVSQRVAALLDEGVPPVGIVAFTFTERAATELKERISDRVAYRSGREMLDRLNGLFVGTIHAYCFRLLQQHVPRFETYDVLDDKQLTAFLSREATRLGIKQLDSKGRTFASIKAFLKGIDVLENEMLSPTITPEPFRSIAVDYYNALERYRLLTYGQQIVMAVQELQAGPLAGNLHKSLRHLIVDEYQDVNPAQEQLIELMTGPETQLCVVGDDQQAIYQWRGSDVRNIKTFATRYTPVETFEITTNFRSVPAIIEAANAFAEPIPDRLGSDMAASRAPTGSEAAVVAWSEDAESDEAGRIAGFVVELESAGVLLKDIAILVRSRAAYKRLLEQFDTFGIPVQPGGRTGLFDREIAIVLGKTFAWLTDTEWRVNYERGALVTDGELLDGYLRAFELPPAKRQSLAQLFGQWKAKVGKEDRPVDLVGELYVLLEEIDVKSWDFDDPIAVNRLGTLARFSMLLVDYEVVRRRSRPDADNPGEQVGGQDRGRWYYRNLATHIINYAAGAYEDFDGEPDFVGNAVDLTTVHRAKGLEWPAVFVPSMTARRFPSPYTGKEDDWPIPRELFDAARYEGADDDERRLFYVAMTRARDWLSVSRHNRITKQRAKPSPYYGELAAHEVNVDDVEIPPIVAQGEGEDATLAITFSELASFLDCGLAYRLRTLIGFQPHLAPELGYGKAIHHVLRTVAHRTKEGGKVPTAAELDEILDKSFYLPTANKAAHRQMKDAARRLVTTYSTEHEGDLHRVWETERPFELHLDGVIVSGRADVILDREGGVETALAIVDYKTSTSNPVDEYALQLQVYADAGRREGLDVAAAYLHDLKASVRSTIGVAASDVESAEETVINAAGRLRERDYRPNPGPKCRVCEVRSLCRHSV